MIYEAWRINYQSSEQAARAAYVECDELRSKIEAAEKERDWHAERCEDVMNECGALRAKLEVAESAAAHQKVIADSALRVAEGWERKCHALRAKIAEMEKTWLSPDGYHILMQEREDMLFQVEKMKQHAPCKDISMWPTHHTQPTQPAPSVPEGVSFIDPSQFEGVVSTEIVHSYPPPSGWLRAIDEALVVAHLGVANVDDTYEQAKAKLDSLVGFHVDVPCFISAFRGTSGP